jgi:hypothetical protein
MFEYTHKKFAVFAGTLLIALFVFIFFGDVWSRVFREGVFSGMQVYFVEMLSHLPFLIVFGIAGLIYSRASSALCWTIAVGIFGGLLESQLIRLVSYNGPFPYRFYLQFLFPLLFSISGFYLGRFIFSIQCSQQHDSPNCSGGSPSQ